MSPNFKASLLVLTVLLLAFTTFAQAAPAYNEALISWENAILEVDGTPIPAIGPDSLKETSVQRSICSATGTFGTSLQEITVPVVGGPLSVLFQALPDNTVQCFRARHMTEAGVFSNWTVSVVSKTITPPVVPKKPKPPLNPRAQ